MANRKIKMHPPGSLDVLYPQTTASAVIEETDKKFMTDAEKSKLASIKEITTARFVVGTSTAGWTAADCDYLCDGTADQTEINAAITALPATGGEIVILDGIYNITAKINVTKDNVSIRGNGNATILKRMFNSSVKEGVITLTNRSGCKIANLQIDGNKTSYTNSNNSSIYLYSSSNNTVTGNTCNNNSDSSIYLYSSSNNTVTGNTCNNNNNGIYIRDSSNNTVTGNTGNNNYNSGIYLRDSSNNNITGNVCIRGTGQTSDYTSDQYTIRLQGTANSYNLISSNNCMGKAPVVEGGTGNTLVNNKWDASDDIQNLDADKVDKAWGTTIQAIFINGWTGTLEYSKNDLGEVWLRGTINAPTTVAWNQAICYMPALFKPTNTINIPIMIRVTGTSGISIDSDGTMRFRQPASDLLDTSKPEDERRIHINYIYKV
ncbi:MAG: right-handed parallel beta-helix repeat-containing protein [Spirochaetales bacterium]|nr:right-handed parallel beta-helix repeat-containing protein [Spirochaetales bacterium]